MPRWFQPETVTLEVGGRPLTIETGRLAKQAAGAALVTYGETVVLVTAVTAKPREGIDFFPLTVDFVEKTSAAGKIPGGFFKREGRLADREVLVSRFIDRAIRPLFPDWYRDETQITATVLSADGEFWPDIPAFVGASAALTISEIPFLGPISAVRVGRVDGVLVVNPLHSQLPSSDLELVVAGSRKALVMVEGSAQEIPENEILDALKFAHAAIVPQLDVQEDLSRRVGKAKKTAPPPADRADLVARVREKARAGLEQALSIRTKAERYAALKEADAAVVESFAADYRSERVALDTLEAVEKRREGYRALVDTVKHTLHDLRSELMRDRILTHGARIDGRTTTDIRPIACEVRVAPRAHGTGLFTRGETQALVYCTLGSSDDEQTIDALTERYEKQFLLHYNFPPFSVGEARPLRGPGRREVGHGNLAERALKAVLPPHEKFPYTIRVVAETLESNGSSSMAAVCGGALALMDAGVPISAPVAGIAMGLIQEGDRVAVLSDILGDEDHLGDMDFKVAGTRRGVTAVQMDIKIESVDWSVMERALQQANAGRQHILDCMEAETREDLKTLSARPELSRYAPRLEVIWIKPDRIRDIIGPGGRVIRAIQDTTGVKIDVEDSGRVTIFSPDLDALERGRAMVQELTQEAEIGRIYLGKVKRITDFGAFVEIFPGTDGLVHVSQLAEGRVERVTDVVSEGDEVLAKCIDIDPTGRIRLSRKEALADVAGRE
ncbi:MAG: polyribonucleotide nucleotidyltransferase [Deltaproteobacteria bacterium]|nr:polyribonucleotide nucleotidyltransferase [Deltaproteobacteria bacterium]